MGQISKQLKSERTKSTSDAQIRIFQVNSGLVVSVGTAVTWMVKSICVPLCSVRDILKKRGWLFRCQSDGGGLHRVCTLFKTAKTWESTCETKCEKLMQIHNPDLGRNPKWISLLIDCKFNHNSVDSKHTKGCRWVCLLRINAQMSSSDVVTHNRFKTSSLSFCKHPW